ncbi:MAG TPA: RidA family protein [Verrucomicrobiae bacterium]|nr:RidA family protein [Verrucomicrobiae bacterium]
MKSLDALGITLPPPTAPVGSYLGAVRTGQLVFLSGHIAKKDGVPWAGRVGAEISREEATAAARSIAIDLLGTLHGAVGDLARVRRLVKLTVLVNGAPGFAEHHLVANGATDLFLEIFGAEAAPVRTSYGAQLPLNACVEIDLIAEVG